MTVSAEARCCDGPVQYLWDVVPCVTPSRCRWMGSSRWSIAPVFCKKNGDIFRPGLAPTWAGDEPLGIQTAAAARSLRHLGVLHGADGAFASVLDKRGWKGRRPRLQKEHGRPP